MQDSSLSLLDAEDIGRDWMQWRPVGRGEALRACANRTVAVVQRIAGRDVANVLTPESRYFRSDGAFLYDGLRYYVHTRAERGALKALRIDKPADREELEPMETEEGEVSLGSPTSRVPPKSALSRQPSLPEMPEEIALSLPKKLFPIVFELLTPAGKPLPPTPFRVILPDGSFQDGTSDSAGFIRFPDNAVPGQAKLILVDPKKLPLPPPKPPEKHPIVPDNLQTGELILALPEPAGKD